MIDSLLYIFNPANFEAHGTHFLQTPVLFWVFIISNLLIFLSYTLIPLAMIYLVRKRKDIPFNWLLLLYGAFIVLCGVHHLLHTITFWYPIYGVEAVNDIATAVVSFGTFIALLSTIPLLLKIPSNKQLEEINSKLSEEIENHRKAAEALSSKNQEVEKINDQLIKKVDELDKMNKLMVGRELKMTELKKEIENLRKQ